MSAESPKILCVDDDPDVLAYLKIVLESGGFEYVGAASAEEGLATYKEHQPDLIVLDLMMEEVDAGTGFVQKIRLLGSDVPIFMLSSVGDNLNMTADYSSLGLAGIFQKPLDKDVLLNVVRMALAESSPA
jgi:DNA-binding response OmpR family regulator